MGRFSLELKNIEAPPLDPSLRRSAGHPPCPLSCSPDYTQNPVLHSSGCLLFLRLCRNKRWAQRRRPTKEVQKGKKKKEREKTLLNHSRDLLKTIGSESERGGSSPRTAHLLLLEKCFFFLRKCTIVNPPLDGLIYKVEKYFPHNWVTLNSSNCILISMRAVINVTVRPKHISALNPFSMCFIRARVSPGHQSPTGRESSVPCWGCRPGP